MNSWLQYGILFDSEFMCYQKKTIITKYYHTETHRAYRDCGFGGLHLTHVVKTTADPQI